MLDLAKLATVTTIVCHDNCPDGRAAAMLLQDAFGPDRQIEIIFAQHGTDAYRMMVPKPGMLFCDITPFIEVEKVGEEYVVTDVGRLALDIWLSFDTLVLDHHKTMKNVVAPFAALGRGVFGDEISDKGVCGAVLAYQHVWKPLQGRESSFIDNFARLAGIRDTWQKHNPDFREASLQAEVLMFYPAEHWLTDDLLFIGLNWQGRYRPIGEILMQRQEKAVANIATNGFRFTTAKGTRVVAFDNLKKASDVAEKLGDTADLVVGFCYVSDPPSADGAQGAPKLLLSTRSHTGYDCAALASRFGGGGHTPAAGFNRRLEPSDPQPFTWIRLAIEEHEGSPAR
jgi:hypothetical protein